MKYSMMSYTMARQPGFSIPEMLKLTVDLKLDGIDFVTLYDKKAKELRMMTDDLGIPVVCHTFCPDLNHSTPEDRVAGLDACKRGVEAAVELGAPVVMVVTPTKPGRGRTESRRNWIEGLKEAVGFAKKAGVAMTVENFPGETSPFVVAEDFLEAADAVPGLQLTFDNGNAATGEDPAASFTACAAHAVHAHFKDWDVSTAAKEGFNRMLDGRYYRPALIGEGAVDHRACLSAMKAANYKGCINIEYEGNTYTPADAIRRAVDFLRAAES